MTRTVMLAGIGFGLTILGTPSVVVLGAAYSFTFKAFGGVGPFKFTETGSLPSGLTFTDNGNGTATIAGTTSAPGNFPITITLSDAARTTVTASYSLTVQPLPLSISGHIAGGTTGAAASGSYSASGGLSPYTFTVISGTFPTTGGLSSAGAALGNWSSIGAYSWTVRVTDSLGATATLSDSCSVAYPTLTLTGSFASPSTVTSAYSSSIAISGGNGVYSNQRITSGTLPAGLSLSISGSNMVLSGTSTTATNYSFTAAVDSGDGQTATSAQTVNIQADATAVSIYNKIAGAANGEYWDLSEATGTRAGTANAHDLTALAASGTTDATTTTGPRGGSDVAIDFPTPGTSYKAWAYVRTTGDGLDVPASGGDFTLFGWFKFRSASYCAVGGLQSSGSPTSTGYFVYGSAPNTGLFVGDPSGAWTSVTKAIPDTTTWHFWVMRYNWAAKKAYVSIDGGTESASAAGTGAPPQSNLPFELGQVASSQAYFACSRLGYAKGSNLTSGEITWLMNSGNGRNWAEIKALAGH